MGSTLLYLIRHGEQEHAPAGGDDPGRGLSPWGEEQAKLLGARLAGIPFDVVRHGPLRRAAETAQILAAYLPGIPVSASELLNDRTPVPLSGHEDDVPPQYRWFLDTIPVEERDHGGARLDAAVAQLAVAGEVDRRELLVTHNFVIGWFVRHVLDAPWWRWMNISQANCAITIVQFSADEPPALISFNDTGHLPAQSPGDAGQ